LIPEGQREQTVYLTAAPWFRDRSVVLCSCQRRRRAGMLPVWLRVRARAIAKSEQASARR